MLCKGSKAATSTGGCPVDSDGYLTVCARFGHQCNILLLCCSHAMTLPFLPASLHPTCCYCTVKCCLLFPTPLSACSLCLPCLPWRKLLVSRVCQQTQAELPVHQPPSCKTIDTTVISAAAHLSLQPTPAVCQQWTLSMVWSYTLCCSVYYCWGVPIGVCVSSAAVEVYLSVLRISCTNGRLLMGSSRVFRAFTCGSRECHQKQQQEGSPQCWRCHDPGVRKKTDRT